MTDTKGWLKVRHSMVHNCSRCDKLAETAQAYGGRWLCLDCWNVESAGPFPVTTTVGFRDTSKGALEEAGWKPE